jgi:subtilisin family serine protease
MPTPNASDQPVEFELTLDEETAAAAAAAVASTASGLAAAASFAAQVTGAASSVLPQMDPRLQRLLALQRNGVHKAATSSTGHDEVAVIARVTDEAAWEALSEVRVGARIGLPEKGSSIVTGRIPLARVEHVRGQPFVLSLKAAQPVRLQLHRTVEEIGATPDLLPVGHQANGGEGVVVGIVDFGLDYRHKNFRHADGKSRVIAIWDQSGPTGPQSPSGYGKLYVTADIDAALKKPDPYAALGYAPPVDPVGGPYGTHGTHVADIAAGNGRGTGTAGVAPQADIAFVEIAAGDVPWSGPEVVGKSFGDSVQLLEAVQYLFDLAGSRPCVVNLSLGTNGGPHDGTTLFEDGIDRAVRAAPNRAVVIAASNSYADGIHAAGAVDAGGATDLVWQIPSNPVNGSEFELWYKGPDRFTLEIIAPDGSSLGRVGPGAPSMEIKHEGKVVLFAANRLNDPNNHDNQIGVFLEQDLPAGAWTLRLHGDEVHDGSFHAWIERNDAAQSQFAPPQDNDSTIGSISCGHEAIAVGSYDAHKPTTPLSYFSSAGRTRDGREKPEVSAPGHDVLAARSRTLTSSVRKSGTSMASPAVTGVVALVLAEARARGLSLSVAQIRQVLIQTARKNPPPGPGWDKRYGHGRVSATAAVQAVIAMAPAPTPIPPMPTVASRRARRRNKPAGPVKPRRRAKPAKRQRRARVG